MCDALFDVKLLQLSARRENWIFLRGSGEDMGIGHFENVPLGSFERLLPGSFRPGFVGHIVHTQHICDNCATTHVVSGYSSFIIVAAAICTKLPSSRLSSEL